MRLSELTLNESATIENIECTDVVTRRLLDLGLIEGTKIVPILISPFGDPKVYRFRGSNIALRKEDAENIKVVKNGN